MSKERDIDSYFTGMLENISTIIENSFYEEKDKEVFQLIQLKIQAWYKNYKERNTLIGIEPKELEYLELEITDFFDKYIKDESVNENYVERLLYDFGSLEKIWKEEMLKVKNII